MELVGRAIALNLGAAVFHCSLAEDQALLESSFVVPAECLARSRRPSAPRDHRDGPAAQRLPFPPLLTERNGVNTPVPRPEAGANCFPTSHSERFHLA
jgi:hypothetical protein